MPAFSADFPQPACPPARSCRGRSAYTGGEGEDTLLPYDIRGNGKDDMFDVSDDDARTVGVIGMADYAALREAQRAA